MHPLVLHFPIAVLITAGALELARLKWQGGWLDPALILLLALGAVSALTSAAMGQVLSMVDSYSGDTVFWHRIFGIGVATTACMALALRMDRAMRIPNARVLSNLSLAACVVLIFVTGYHGGALTHGRNFLSEALPRALTAQSEAEIRFRLANDHFVKVIEPILEKHCFECHGPDKQEGGLRLDLRDWALDGGDSGLPAIVPGGIRDSELVRRLFGARDHADAMPPEGRPRPDAADLVALLDWISLGAPWQGYSLGPTFLPADLLSEGVQAVSPGAVDLLRSMGARVELLSMDNPLLQVDLSRVEASSLELVDALTAVNQSVAWLDLSGLSMDDHVPDLASGMPRLTRLSLAFAAGVDDSSLHWLAEINSLYSLNLVATDVTAQGVSELIDHPNLSHIYLWRSQVRQDDMQALQRAFGHTELHFGALMLEPSEANGG